jgi:glycine cleavage system H protein
MTYYSESHEWIKVEGNIATIGITDYAQHALGEIVFIELPDEDEKVTKDAEFGALESVKAASDLFSPVSGTILEVNRDLEDEPESLNEDAENIWIIKVEMSNQEELDDLLNKEQYLEICE